jgi:hypothetical protein
MRFNKVSGELMKEIDLGPMHSLMAAQMLPYIANAIPESAALAAKLMESLAWVYGYTAVFVNEKIPRKSVEPEEYPEE